MCAKLDFSNENNSDTSSGTNNQAVIIKPFLNISVVYEKNNIFLHNVAF